MENQGIEVGKGGIRNNRVSGMLADRCPTVYAHTL